MGRTRKLLGTLDTYMDFYSYVSKVKRSSQDVTKYLQSKKKGASTISDHLKTARDGKLMYISFEDDTFSLDCGGLAQELMSVISQLNLDVYIAEKKGKPEDSIPSVTSANSPQFEEMNKKLNAANNKNKKLQTDLKKKDEEIAGLQKKIQQVLCESIFTEMNKKILVPGTLVSNPVEVLARDIFNECADKDVKRESASLYETKVEVKKELTEKNVIQHVCNQFKDSGVYKKFFGKKEVNPQSENVKQKSDREKAIALLLANEEMDNQTKLSTYALWYFHDDPEMEELLTYAGDYGINANYVIRILEQPGERNYRTIRAFLKQAMSASEAHIKRRTVQELLCGDWQAVAKYRGKMCHFKLVPVEEIRAFRNLLLKYDQGNAACMACQMITSGPMDQKLIQDGGELNTLQIEVPGFVHEADGDVDIHVAIDESLAMNDFAETEVKADE